jgi:hypothetical protein
MSNDEGMTKPESRKQDRHLLLAFDIVSTLVIRISSFKVKIDIWSMTSHIDTSRPAIRVLPS